MSIKEALEFRSVQWSGYWFVKQCSLLDMISFYSNIQQNMRCCDAKVPFPWACTKWGQNEDRSLQHLLFYHHLCQTIHHQYCNHIGHLEAPNLVSLSAFKAFRSRLSKSKVLNNQDGGHTQTSKQTSAPNAVASILAWCSTPSCTRLLLKYASALAKRSPARGGCVGTHQRAKILIQEMLHFDRLLHFARVSAVWFSINKTYQLCWKYHSRYKKII